MNGIFPNQEIRRPPQPEWHQGEALPYFGRGSEEVGRAQEAESRMRLQNLFPRAVGQGLLPGAGIGTLLQLATGNKNLSALSAIAGLALRLFAPTPKGLNVLPGVVNPTLKGWNPPAISEPTVSGVTIDGNYYTPEFSGGYGFGNKIVGLRPPQTSGFRYWERLK